MQVHVSDVVGVSLIVRYTGTDWRAEPSYGAQLCTQGLRVQALRGGTNSPTSRCPEAWSIGLCVKLQGVRTLVLEEGVAYIEFVRPLRPSVTQGLRYIKMGHYW